MGTGHGERDLSRCTGNGACCSIQGFKLGEFGFSIEIKATTYASGFSRGRSPCSTRRANARTTRPVTAIFRKTVTTTGSYAECERTRRNCRGKDVALQRAPERQENGASPKQAEPQVFPSFRESLKTTGNGVRDGGSQFVRRLQRRQVAYARQGRQIRCS